MADHTLFPSIVPDSDEPFVDSTYSRDELRRMDYNTQLRKIAAAHPSDAVHGRMDKAELVENLTGLERVEI